ncbi:MAG: hypothetical protein KIS94_06090 [Chitinophagales bacterium]|nr:hypothetical protein [Chitinophagales bacterium]
MVEETKPCQFCAQLIVENAALCRHCQKRQITDAEVRKEFTRVNDRIEYHGDLLKIAGVFITIGGYMSVNAWYAKAFMVLVGVGVVGAGYYKTTQIIPTYEVLENLVQKELKKR